MIQQRLPETEMRRAEEREYLNKEQRGKKNFLLWRDIEKNLPLDIDGSHQIGNCDNDILGQKQRCLIQIAELSPKYSAHVSENLKILITMHLKRYAAPKVTPLKGK